MSGLPATTILWVAVFTRHLLSAGSPLKIPRVHYRGKIKIEAETNQSEAIPHQVVSDGSSQVFQLR